MTNLKWEKIKNSSSYNSFHSLFENKIGYIEIDNFLNAIECELLVNELRKLGLKQYEYIFKETEAPPAAHLFTTHYLYEEKTLQEYLTDAAESYKIYNQLTYNIKFDPVKKVLEYIANIMKIPVEVARENNQDYFHCIARELNHSVLLHPDYAPYQAPGRIISKIIGQYAWNIYLTDPKEGGLTTVYNKPWQGAEDDKLFATETYGYSKNAVLNAESATFKVHAGKLVFFNSRNYHEVTATKEPRISIGGHLGLTQENRIMAWS